jgi:fructokinase
MSNNSIHAPARVVAIGEILWDLLPEGRRIGGATANFAYHTNARGVAATLVSCVGSDPLGREILDQVARWNMDTRTLCTRPEYPTGWVDVKLDSDGKPEYVIHENVAWDHIAWNDAMAALATSVDCVCFGTLGQRAEESRSTIRWFLDSTRASCLRVCDINLRQSYFSTDILRSSLVSATVVKLNDEELPVVAGHLGISGAPESMLAELRDTFRLDLVALTKGGAGSTLLTADRRSDHPGYRVKVIDTVGAGDAFTAALVVGLLQGADLDVINADANRAAADVCMQAGAIPVMESDSLPARSGSGESDVD